LVVGADGVIGFYARRSHQVVDVPHCTLLAPELQPVLDAVRRSVRELPAGAEIDLQVGREGVHAAIRLPVGAATAQPEGETLFKVWRAAGVVGMRLTGPRGARAFGAPDVDIAGTGEDPLRIPAGGFAQVGRAANAALVAAVMEAVGSQPGAVLELYAGSGNFTRALAARAVRLTAGDADREAVARGRRSVPRASWSLGPPSAGDTDADTVVVDPPREGLDGANLAAAAAARRRLVYVSCDPQTLARDAARLAAKGLVLRRAVALDLMPHTFHVEVVAVFERAT
jgi:23S rRNA (uracil1939-C5)-methyltransferase